MSAADDLNAAGHLTMGQIIEAGVKQYVHVDLYGRSWVLTLGDDDGVRLGDTRAGGEHETGIGSHHFDSFDGIRCRWCGG